MRRSMMIGVYGALSLGAVDIAFSLTRFLKIQTGGVGDFRAMTTIRTFCLTPPAPSHIRTPVSLQK